MKKVIVIGLSVVILVPLVFVIYSMWWIEHTHELFAPAVNYFDFTTKLLDGWCGNEDGCCARCLRDLMQSDSTFWDEIDDNLEFLTPPEEIKHLGFLIAKDLRLPDNRVIPIIVCKTPIASVRVEEGEPPGKNHLAGFAHTGLRKMTPDEFKSLDKSLFIDIEIVIKELKNMSMERN
jgi:hypothetical protein